MTLASGYLARGVVDEVVFTGAFERLRVRLAEGARPSCSPPRTSDARDAAGDAHPARTARLRGAARPGGRDRRAPRARAADAALELHGLRLLGCARAALSQQRLLTELAARMKTRIGARTEPQLGVPQAPCQGGENFVGTTVLAAQPDAARRAEWLLTRGAQDLLVLPDEAARRSGCSSTGSARRRATRRSRSRRACCATCPPKPSTSASFPGRPPAPARRTACASCWMRARRRRRRTAWRCAPSCTSATRRARAGAAPRRGARADADPRRDGAHALRRALRRTARPARWPVLIVHREAARELPPAEHPARFRADLRLHDAVPEHHRAAAARGAGARGRLHALERLRAHGAVGARARLLPSVLRRLAPGRLASTWCSASSSPGRWCATSSRAARSSTRSSTCRSRCRPRSPASPSPPCSPQNGWIGRYLEPLGIKVAYTWIGVTLALTLISMPFAVRAVQPALLEVQRDLEEAAETLGAGRALRVPSHHPADRAARAPHRLHARVRARGRGVRLGDLHRRQPADEDRDHPAPDRHPPRAVRLPGGRRPRRGDAGDLLRHAARDQPAAGLGPAAPRARRTDGRGQPTGHPRRRGARAPVSTPGCTPSCAGSSSACRSRSSPRC